MEPPSGYDYSILDGAGISHCFPTVTIKLCSFHSLSDITAAEYHIDIYSYIIWQY